MWWKCEVEFCRNVLALKIWAKNEPDARAKVARMYRLASIRSVAPLGGACTLSCDAFLAAALPPEPVGDGSAAN